MLHALGGCPTLIYNLPKIGCEFRKMKESYNVLRSLYGLDEKNNVYGSETQNLRFFGHFGKMEGLSKVFDEVNDLWIMGVTRSGRVHTETERQDG